MFAVICAGSMLFASALLLAQATIPRYGRKPADKGPRALGLVQLKGTKARFIPIAIMMDGKFYDAGSYKASPVPMALDFGIVYEGFRSGVSQGVFTITQPGQLNHAWIAEGTWLPVGAIDPKRPKKYSAPVVVEDDNGPPVLHRRAGSSDSENSSDKKDEQKPATPAASPTTTVPASSAPTPTNSPEAAKPPAAPEAAKATPPPTAKTSTPVSRSDEPMEDPNRPRLRRGKPESTARRDVYTTFEEDAAPAADTATSAKDSVTSAPQIISIPAISDAGGPDPRPYTFDVRPGEEANYRSKMLDLAAKQLSPQASAATKETAATGKKAATGKSAHQAASKPPQPAFDNVSLRIFDLSSSNEPVLVLSAKTHPAAVPADAGTTVEQPKEITLIARTNLEGELRKLFFSQTDSHHLDVSPRMELIDAVDADGDGRGELLFRRTFDNGSAYAIYRVSADRLWPLFEPTP
jgi:hypothetical protein